MERQLEVIQNNRLLARLGFYEIIDDSGTLYLEMYKPAEMTDGGLPDDLIPMVPDRIAVIEVSYDGIDTLEKVKEMDRRLVAEHFKGRPGFDIDTLTFAYRENTYHRYFVSHTDTEGIVEIHTRFPDTKDLRFISSRRIHDDISAQTGALETDARFIRRILGGELTVRKVG